MILQRAGISLKVRRTLGMRDLSFENINIVKSPFKRAGVRNAGPTFRLSAFSKMTFRLSDFQQIKKSFSKMTFRLSAKYFQSFSKMTFGQTETSSGPSVKAFTAKRTFSGRLCHSSLIETFSKMTFRLSAFSKTTFRLSAN